MSQPKNPDPEAQFARSSTTPFEAEYIVPTRTKLAYLAVYFLCNVSLTIYNKANLEKFSYPWLLTAIHTGSASIGCYILLLRGKFSLTKLSFRENIVLVVFSFLFTINIAMSNISLAMVSMPFHQIMRSTCPVFTVLIYRLRYNRVYSIKTYLSLVPVIVGIGLATYGDYYFTPTGFYLTILGVIMAAIKTVATNRIMTGPLALSPLEILLRMSPLAFVQAIICSYLTGELFDFYCSLDIAPSLSSSTEIPIPSPTLALALAGNGLIAFMLNISSFTANKYTGALTITVCGNVKHCLTILLGIFIFGVKVGYLNGVGMLVALAGAAWYSAVELDSKGKR